MNQLEYKRKRNIKRCNSNNNNNNNNNNECITISF